MSGREWYGICDKKDYQAWKRLLKTLPKLDEDEEEEEEEAS